MGDRPLLRRIGPGTSVSGRRTGIRVVRMKPLTFDTRLESDVGWTVCSHNEWDRLEEVIVGVADGATVPCWDAMLRATMPVEQESFFREHGGRSFPHELVAAAARELDARALLLQSQLDYVQAADEMDTAIGRRPE